MNWPSIPAAKAPPPQWELGDGSSPEEQQRFRRVMGRFATGITVITTSVDGEVWGMTANAFMAGSLEPPLCIVAIGKHSRLHGLLETSGQYCVSILSREQWHLSSHFAGRPTPGLAPEFAELGGRPVLARSLAAISTDVAERVDCGDHTLFIGRILHMSCTDDEPLLFFGGRYANLRSAPRIEELEPPMFW